MKRAESQVALSPLLQFHKRADVLHNIGCVADFLDFIVGDSHRENVVKRRRKNKNTREC